MNHLVVTRQKVEKSLEKVKQVLDATKHPILAADVSHRYIDKMSLAEFLTNSSICAVFSCLSMLGVTTEHFFTFKEWSKTQTVTLQLQSEQKCRFVRKESREVESKTKHVVESSLFGKSTSKSITTVTDYIWEFTVSYELKVYRGTGANSLTDCISIQSRTSSCDIVTAVDKSPKVEHLLAPTLETSLSWLLQHMEAPENQESNPPGAEFHIDKLSSACHTPRRNADVEAALTALGGLSRWCLRVHSYFFDSVFSQAPDRSELDMSVICSDTVFVPVLPILNDASGVESNSSTLLEQLEQKSDDELIAATPASEDQCGSVLSVGDSHAFLQEQHRSLSKQCEAAGRILPAATAHRSLISAAEGTLLVTLLHLRDIVDHYSYGVDYLEEMLRDQLVSAIGKVIQPKDFCQYMKYHNTKLLKTEFHPRPFCYSVRRSGGHAPEGGVFLEESSGGGGDMTEAVNTLVSSASRNSSGVMRKFTLNASTTVSFTGSTHVHAYMSHRFENDHKSSKLSLRAEARQFSGFLVLIGSIPSADTFDPQHAFICQNKDEFIIPLDSEMIPSPKAFKDAIESLSPEQQRIAEAFRGMQLASTLFGVLVVQIKPQLEKILNLPPDSLTKEIKLTQDLMDLFIKYQIPSDLLSFDPSSLPTSHSSTETIMDGVSIREKLDTVKGHVSAMHDMIGLTKQQELAQRKEEVQYNKAADLLSMSQGFAFSGAAPPPPPQMGGLDAFGDCGGAGMRGATFGGAVRSCSSSSQVVRSPHASAPQQLSAVPGGKILSMKKKSKGIPDPRPIKTPDTPVANSSLTQPSMPVSSVSQPLKPNQQQNERESSGEERDCTLLPTTLNEKFDQLDRDGAVRPVILSVSEAWKKRSQKALLAAATTTTLHADEQKTERSAAFDLLDALSRSGGLVIDNTALHVVLVSTHCFDKTLMDTVIQKNTNPIEKMEQSTLIMASVIHDKSAEELLNESQRDRLHSQTPMLFEDTN